MIRTGNGERWWGGCSMCGPVPVCSQRSGMLLVPFEAKEKIAFRAGDIGLCSKVCALCA